MPEEQAVAAALAWADRNEGGKSASYDPYIVALAQVVREQREYIKGLEVAARISPHGEAQEIVVELGYAQDRIAELEEALRPLAENWDLYSSDHLSMEGKDYRIVPTQIVQEISRAMTRGKFVLAKES